MTLYTCEIHGERECTCGMLYRHDPAKPPHLWDNPKPLDAETEAALRQALKPPAKEPATITGPPVHIWSLGGRVTVELRCSAPLNRRHFALVMRYAELAASAAEDEAP